MSSSPSLEHLLSLPRNQFLEYLGPIYEKSPWVAEKLFNNIQSKSSGLNIRTLRELHSLMAAIVDVASQNQKMTLLLSHPDLCEKIAALKNLTAESQEEQSRAGLQHMTEDEHKVFSTNNEKYRSKFGFPFILAVRNATKYTVLSSIQARVKNSVDTEFVAALKQVHKIAWMRLLSTIAIDKPKGFLTCHVLDTSMGCPAANMRIQLQRISSPKDANNVVIGEYITNSDGRLPGGPALKGDSFQVGVYEWTFFVGDYFASKNVDTSGMPFLDVVPIRFGIDDPDEHYHVPLLVSPWSFSTYRGS